MSHDNPDPDLLCGVDEIARFLRQPRRKTQHWIDAHHLPTFRIGRSVCAYRGAVKAWLDAQAGQGGAQ